MSNAGHYDSRGGILGHIHQAPNRPDVFAAELSRRGAMASARRQPQDGANLAWKVARFGLDRQATCIRWPNGEAGVSEQPASDDPVVELPEAAS